MKEKTPCQECQTNTLALIQHYSHMTKTTIWTPNVGLIKHDADGKQLILCKACVKIARASPELSKKYKLRGGPRAKTKYYYN